MGIKDYFNMRFLGGDVRAESFATFNAKRFLIIEKRPELSLYFAKKQDFVRTCVNIFNEKTEEFIALAKEVSNE